MSLQFKKAERRQVKLRIGLIGPSGSGKTFTALRLTKGMGGATALIDTENRRSEYYANEFEFDVLQLAPPFTPERYIEAIEAAEAAGYENLILDSISHEWIGKGGLIEVHSNMPGNSYTNWSKITPRHDAFIDKILRADLHVIATIRGKDEYVLEEKNGKQTPKKVGVGGQQRDGFEYECTAAFIIEQDSHVATATKDNTHLFDMRYEKLTEEHGRLLKQWAEDGVEVIPLATKQQKEEIAKLAEIKAVDVGFLAPGWTGKQSSKEWTVKDYEIVREKLAAL
ncbi:MAG TPA: AAA family ATPase [Negativicutes bacterium]|nr:AAA family ATPase [Negativicutes bacterium]